MHAAQISQRMHAVAREVARGGNSLCASMFPCRNSPIRRLGETLFGIVLSVGSEALLHNASLPTWARCVCTSLLWITCTWVVLRAVTGGGPHICRMPHHDMHASSVVHAGPVTVTCYVQEDASKRPTVRQRPAKGEEKGKSAKRRRDGPLTGAPGLPPP